MREFSIVPGGSTVQGRDVQGVLPIDVDESADLRLYKLVLPFLPPSKNIYDSWPGQWKHSAKRKWVRWISEWAYGLSIPQASQVGLAAVLVFPTKGRRDPQNYAQALWHWVPDALQEAGVLDDDREGHVQIGPNWGLSFAYDLRPGVPKERRQRTLLAVTMRVK